MSISFPNNFYCYDDFDDTSDYVVQEMIGRLLDKMQSNTNMSVVIESIGNTEVIIFKQYRKSIEKMVYRIVVMKDHYEKIVELDNENLVFINREEAENSGCLGCGT